MHLQLLPAPLVIRTACRGACRLPFIGDIVLNIQHTMPVCSHGVHPPQGQRQISPQQHRVNNRPTIGCKLGQVTIKWSSVNKPQCVVPGRIGSRQPFKRMQTHTSCPICGQGISGAASADRLHCIPSKRGITKEVFLSSPLKYNERPLPLPITVTCKHRQSAGKV
jgi:hypothetical protein